MHIHRWKPEVNLRHSSLLVPRAAHLALGVFYWDLGLIIEARLVGQGTQGSSCPHLPALGITSACHMPGFLCVVPVPTITTEPQAAYLLSCLSSSPSYSQSSVPGPSLQRCLVTQGHSQHPRHLHCPSRHSCLPLHASLGLLPSVLVSSRLVAESPTSPAFCIQGLLLVFFGIPR